MDNKHAWAHVQAWKKNDPTLVKEDKVTIVFSMEFQSYVWNYVKDGCKRHKGGCPVVRENGKVIFDEGTPILEDQTDQLDLRLLLNRKMRFAERECITKAEGRLHKKLLNMEWREPEEIENEATDVKTVSDKSPMIPAQSSAPKAAVATAPVTAAAAAPVKPAEAPKPAAATPAAKPETKKPEKPKEEPKKDNPAPTEAATAPGPPKAVIPTITEIHKAGEVPAPAGPPKRSERVAKLASDMQCSGGNIMQFMAFALNCTTPELNVKPKHELDAVIYALEYLVKDHPASTMGTWVKKEPMSKEYKDKLDAGFTLLFAQEMNKHAEVK
jgi:hypothetical protein